MQINIGKKSSIAIVVAILAASIGLIISNQNSDDIGMNHDSHSMMGTQSSQSEEFSSSDVMFAQMMIPHHEQAVLMSELALEKSKNGQVIALAKQIKNAQAPEIELMKSWLNSAEAGLEMGHDMGMGGALSDDEISQLKNATGKAFDQKFLEGMIGHHQGAIQMVEMISSSTNAAVIELGKNIVSSQSAEIKVMEKLLKAIG